MIKDKIYYVGGLYIVQMRGGQQVVSKTYVGLVRLYRRILEGDVQYLVGRVAR